MEGGTNKIEKQRKLLAGVILCAIVILLIYLHILGSLKKKTQLVINVPANIAQGDFILRKGKGMLSGIIENMLNDGTGISHCGVIVQDSTSRVGFSVIHAVSNYISEADGVRKTCLIDFMRESVPGTNEIIRHKAATPEISHALVQDASFYLEQSLPFDHSFNLANHDAIFCSELLYILCKKNLGDTLYKGTMKPYYSFAVFRDTGRFTKVWPIKKPPESGF